MWLIGCTPLDSIDIEDVWYRVLDENYVDFSMAGRFDPALGDRSKYFFFVDKSLLIRVTAIEYETVLPDNKTPVIASGVLYHPLNKKSRGVFDLMPTARLGAGVAGSEMLYAIEGVLAFKSYTILMPDFIGSGSSDYLPMPFLMVENTGRVAYDMRRAAAKYLWDKYRYTFPVETRIMGYSLGGAAALATQKYYEKHHANTIKVKEVFTGSGVYDLPVAFEAFAKSGISEFVAIPSAIYGLNHYYNLNLDFTKIFTGNLISKNGHLKEDWLFGPHRLSAPGLTYELGREVRNYMHPDFFKSMEEQKGTEFEKLHQAFMENSISEGWRPKAPINMIHARLDACVPVECTETAVKKLRKAGANISFMIYPGNHVSVGILYFLRLILSFI